MMDSEVLNEKKYRDRHETSQRKELIFIVREMFTRGAPKVKLNT
jgi:hypothetical protein